MTNLFILHRFTLNQEAQEKHLLLPNPCTLKIVWGQSYAHCEVKSRSLFQLNCLQSD